MTTTIQLLHDARAVRRNLQLSPRWAGKTSIRDAVEVAADGLRQIEHERAEMTGELDFAS